MRVFAFQSDSEAKAQQGLRCSYREAVPYCSSLKSISLGLWSCFFGSSLLSHGSRESHSEIKGLLPQAGFGPQTRGVPAAPTFQLPDRFS